LYSKCIRRRPLKEWWYHLTMIIDSKIMNSEKKVKVDIFARAYHSRMRFHSLFFVTFIKNLYLRIQVWNEVPQSFLISFEQTTSTREADFPTEFPASSIFIAKRRHSEEFRDSDW
jgi:hypothetical protein